MLEYTIAFAVGLTLGIGASALFVRREIRRLQRFEAIVQAQNEEADAFDRELEYRYEVGFPEALKSSQSPNRNTHILH